MATNKKVKEMYPDIYHDKGFVFAAQKMKKPRHTHTSLLAEAGVSLEQIMHRLGHSNDAITRNVYLHVTKPKRKEASHKFAELMKSF